MILSIILNPQFCRNTSLYNRIITLPKCQKFIFLRLYPTIVNTSYDIPYNTSYDIPYNIPYIISYNISYKVQYTPTYQQYILQHIPHIPAIAMSCNLGRSVKHAILSTDVTQLLWRSSFLSITILLNPVSSVS